MHDGRRSLDCGAVLGAVRGTVFGTAFVVVLGPVLVALIGTSLGRLAAAEPNPAPRTVTVRVGVYDSRAIALAYGNSELHNRRIAEAAAEHKRAKDSGDTGRAEVIEARMEDLQNLRHMQVFGNAPIPDILKDLEAALAEEARTERLDLIVRDIDIAHKGPGVETIDITDALAATYEPSERTLQWMREIRAQPPVPLERFPIDEGRHGEREKQGERGAGGATPPEASPQAVKAAGKAAIEWVRLLDKGSYAESWEAASSHFKAVAPKERWIAEIASLRAGCGSLKGRSEKSARYTQSLPEAPRGEYVILQFAAEFEKKPGAVETVTPVREKDGTWRVDGYYIR